MLRHYRRKQKEVKASKPSKYEKVLRQLLESRSKIEPMIKDGIAYDYYGR